MIATYEINDIYSTWLNECYSKNTKKRYERVVPEFFEMLFNKELEQVNREDIEKIMPVLVNHKYKKTLSDRGVKNSTIKNNMLVIKSFFKQMQINQVFGNDVNYAYIIEKSLSTKNVKVEKPMVNTMHLADYEGLVKWLENERFKGSRYEEKGKSYSLLLQLMWHTGSRVSAVFNLKWVDFVWERDSKDQWGYNVYIFDKGGKTNFKPLQNEELYHELKKHLYQGKDGEKVFKSISQQGFAGLLKEYSEMMNIKELTPHSIKRGAVTTVNKISGDIKTAQKFADHEKIETTIRYIEDENTRDTHGSVYLNFNNMDFKALESLSGKEICDMLNVNNDKVTLAKLFFEAKKTGLI